MAIDSELLQDLMDAVRVKSAKAKTEIEGLTEACQTDLNIKGIYVDDFTDPLAKQALRLYVKANYGYDDNVERFGESYDSLTKAMALSGDYVKGD